LALFSVFLVSSQTDPSDDCAEATNCSGRGSCATDDDGDWYCICDDGYTTHDADDDVYCNYEQKKQLTAFLLAWFLGTWGGGQWYVGLSGLAAGKLCYALAVCCIIPCFLQCFVLKKMSGGLESGGMMGGGGGSSLYGCCYCCCVLGVFVWWLVDIIMFGMNNIDDKNGVGLEPW